MLNILEKNFLILNAQNIMQQKCVQKILSLSFIFAWCSWICAS